MEFLRKWFARSNTSAQNAKGRLISVLIHDRTDISPALLENLRTEMITLLKKYMDIDESNIEINLDRGSREVALVANVPVLRVRREPFNLPETDSKGESKAVRTEPSHNHNHNKNHNKNRRHR